MLVLFYIMDVKKWGFHKAPHVEKVHVEFFKRIMFLRKSTNNVMVYFELGRCPMNIQRKGNTKEILVWFAKN